MLINLRPSTYVMESNVNLGSFGVTWVKVVISNKKCSNSAMLHRMVIRLIHVDQLVIIIAIARHFNPSKQAKICYLTKNAFFHPNLRMFNIYVLASLDLDSAGQRYLEMTKNSLHTTKPCVVTILLGYLQREASKRETAD